MKFLYLKCPVNCCSYRTGASYEGDKGAREALLRHLKRRSHGMRHSIAKVAVDRGTYIEDEPRR